jgi:hypothetical protein
VDLIEAPSVLKYFSWNKDNIERDWAAVGESDERLDKESLAF